MGSKIHKHVHEHDSDAIESRHARTAPFAAADASSVRNTADGRQRDIGPATPFTRRQNTVLLSTMVLLGVLLFVDVLLQLNTPHSFVMLLLLLALGGSYAFTVRAWSECCGLPGSPKSTLLEG